MADELFELRNYFYLGNFSAAVAEGKSIAVDDAGAAIERDVILARVDMAMGNVDAVLERVNDSSPLALQAVRLYALYLKDPSNKEIVFETLKVWLEDPVSSNNQIFLLFAAMIHAYEQDYDNALRCASKGDTLEHMALKVQLLIKMDRLDVAKKEINTMQSIDEDATLSQLASCWVNLASGGNFVQEALDTYQALLERHGATEPLLNGLALCNMALKRYPRAEQTLLEALGKNQNHSDSLINSIVLSKHKKKPAELVSRYYTQLKKVASPSHPWLTAHETFNEQFDAAAAAVCGQ
eukprot:Plantae.Rhodophyta-Purpureofilum_apyrenoidigerum.ctg4869.p2 GENE.Plantae.Rhodophyta-Purpureofilum_apyrenoidigerum.ctg4869~~Plantae.Rhodophyta-Purpureofilum_apyrenoidigerum.ctg4869.p2  ORF type:complete len:322 (-),score=88.72 Plantae.Rhodophyta-Purpureofilum_apyrenoidigerum.ctg4869:1232-2116(-)